MERAENPERRKVQAECCPLIGANVRCMVTLACCFLFSCTLGTCYAFGNINPYLTSYLKNRTSDHDLDYTDTLWIYQAYGIVAAAFTPVVGLLANRVHTKLFMSLGFLCHVGSFVLTYWTMQESFPLVVLTYGVLAGLPLSIIDPTSIRVCVEWLPSRPGLVCALVFMGYGVGAVVWNALTTWYINPDNLQPDLSFNSDLYYTQAAVLDRVPGCFLMLGIACAVIQAVGVTILCLPPHPSSHQKMHRERSEEEEERRGLLDGGDGNDDDDDNEEAEPPASIDTHTQDSLRVDRAAGSGQQITRRRDDTVACCSGNMPSHPDKKSQVGAKVDYTPGEVLKTRVFWTLWLMYACSTMGANFVISLFKAYGETFIDDDHFLALVASLSSVCNAAGRPFWGIMADKIGPRMSSLIAQCALAALVGSFVTCEVTGKAGFMLWVCAMFLCVCGILTMEYNLAISLFGSKHFNVNMGFVLTSGLVGMLLVGFVASPIKAAIGWHGLFYVGFVGLFLGVLLNMSVSIPWKDSIPQDMRPCLSLPSPTHSHTHTHVDSHICT